MSLQSISGQAGMMQIPASRAAAAPASAGGVAATGAPSGLPPDPASAKTPSAKEVQDAVTEIQNAIKPLAQELQFSIDKDTGTTVVKVMDTSTQKILRQFPSEEILQMAKSIGTLQEKFQGLLVKQEA